MSMYDELAHRLNLGLEEYKPIPLAEVRNIRYKGEDFPFVVFENKQNHRGIAISYSEGYWIIEYLGTHVTVPDMEDIDEFILENYVLPIFADMLVVAAMSDGSRYTFMTTELENKKFTSGELDGDPDTQIICWSGALNREVELRCKAYARRLWRK